MRKTLTIFLCGFTMAASALDPNHFTITRISAPYFIVDGKSPATITKAYVGFEVKNNSNSATTYPGLKFTITSVGTSVVGQNYSLISPANGIVNVGTLAPGETKICYYYVSYPASTTPQATFNVQLSDNTASFKTAALVIYNRSSISANAGGTATQSFTNQDLIGGLVYDDVTYAVGNVQNGDESDFQVAVSPQFDPTKILLLGTQVTASAVPGIPVGATDSLYFITGSGTNGATITIRWTFRISATNFTTYLLPCAGSTSGSTNYKYALNTALGQGSPVTVSSSANPLTITKTSDRTVYGVNTTAIFTITIQNPGIYGITIDKVTDEIPAGFSFLSMDASSQVTAANSTTLPTTGATGTIIFDGGVSTGGNNSYYIAAGGSIMIRYTATTASAPASNLLTTARDFVGITEVGAATNTVSVSNTLPVTLLSFNASWLNDQARLEWITTNEINCKSIEIERSVGNAGFSKIGVLPATGMFSSVHTYFFIDQTPSSALNKYRLKLIDLDDQYKYSPVVTLFKKVSGFFIQPVYPNPFSDNLNIQLIADKHQTVQVSLTDMAGKTAFAQSANCSRGSTVIIINIPENLTPGFYVLRVIAADGNCFQQKLVKQQ